MRTASLLASLLSALVVVLLPCAPAGAVTIVDAARPQVAERQQLWADAAAVPTARAAIRLHRTGCPGRPEPACALGADVWLSSRLGSAELERRLLLHELGHVFDARMPEPARRRFSRITRDRRPWRSQRNSAHERFAVAYELCAGRESVEPGAEYGYGYAPSRHAHRAACRLIRRVGRSDPSRFETASPRARDAVFDLGA